MLRLAVSRYKKVTRESYWISCFTKTDFRRGWEEHTVVRGANARIRLGDYCNCADSPDDSNHVLIECLDGL